MNPTWTWSPLAPILCAIHCAATPALIAFAPTLAPLAALEVLETWFLGFTAMIATVALGTGVVIHRRWAVVFPVTAGLAFWAASLYGAFAPVAEEATTAAGTLVVAAGLFWNGRAVRTSTLPRRGCGCATCRGGRVQGRGGDEEGRAVELA